MLQPENSTLFEVKVLRGLGWASLVISLIVCMVATVSAAQSSYVSFWVVCSVALPWFMGGLITFSTLMAFASMTQNLQTLRLLSENKSL